ncbi:hypothetical protein [Rhodococcus pyridinivorans]|uniref:Uncharacterized protein n=1 Tax=Rhodococcus pyridinivorans AK37 TaxID=1114960 RepID=H0JV43_9NOCA|nr:hypothetical protein [Rhodococcus pyridinivorans]EHK82139.1 hypothetical protein AK37_17870 [Rhodococcus pyridinivorans AK37]MCD2140410.1 hypothetical protein [Rhodococcus pyridinivorans]
MDSVTEIASIVAGVCVASLVLGFALGILVDAVVEFVAALRTRREIDAEIQFLAVDAGEIVDPDEPIPYVLAANKSTDDGRVA